MPANVPSLRMLTAGMALVALLLAARTTPALAQGTPSQLDPQAKLVAGQAHPAPAPGPRLKVLSWNLWMLPPLIYPHTKKLNRARGIVTRLWMDDYDVLVFQEAFHPRARKILWEGLKDRYPYAHGPINRKPGCLKTNGGIWILSKYPFRVLGTIKYRDKAGFDNQMARKGALLVELDWQGRRVQIMGTHLNAGGPMDVRLNQAWQLHTELMAPNRQPGVPALLCGDYNIGSRTDGYPRLLDILQAQDGPYHTAPDMWPEEIRQSQPPSPLMSEPRRVDYIFLQPNGVEPKLVRRTIAMLNGAVGRGDDTRLADHRAVEMVLEWAPGAFEAQR